MPTCHHCRKTFDATEDRQSAVCPYCRAVVDPEQPTEWVAVARCASVAEAGYLANVLSAEGIETHIEQHDSFSAIDGSWVSVFLLQTPAADAEHAADRIREQIARDESEPSYAQTSGPPVDSYGRASTAAPGPMDQEESQLGPTTTDWRPLALILFAGAAIFVIGFQFREARIHRATPSDGQTMLRALEKIDRPFVSQPRPGDTRRFRLLFDRRRRVWYLELDRNGDGRYEERRSFR